MTHRDTPPFRADHVGSLLRPQRLTAARDARRAGEMDADRLREIEDECIREVVRMQEDVGLQTATDGEFRRTAWHMDFIYQLGGISPTDEKIQVHWNTVVEDVLGEDKLTGLAVRNTISGDGTTLPVTGLFVAIGHDPRSELVRGQVSLDEEGYVVVDAPSTRTNLDGVFACGDLVDHVYRQAVTAAGTGCQAALDAERWLADRE